MYSIKNNKAADFLRSYVSKNKKTTGYDALYCNYEEQSQCTLQSVNQMHLEENEDVAINIVDEHSSWTVVKKKKKNKKYSDAVKWTKQQKKNFEQFGDPWYQEPYKYYHAAAHNTPVAGPPQPQQQQQQPVLQQQPGFTLILA